MMNDYVSLRVCTEFGSDELTYPERYLTVYQGEIIVQSDVGDEKTIGTVRGRVMDIGSAVHTVDLDEYFDLDSELAEYYSQLFDIDTNVLNYDIQDAYTIPDHPLLLVIDLLRIEESYRGKGHGLSAINAMISHIGVGCDLAVLRAYPLQYSMTFKNHRSLQSYTSLSESAARSKLIKYYAKGGFEQYGDEGYMLLKP